MTLQVLLVTDAMLYNSVTVRLSDMTEEAFLSHLLTYFIDGLAAIIPCPKENIFVFNIQVGRKFIIFLYIELYFISHCLMTAQQIEISNKSLMNLDILIGCLANIVYTLIL